MGIVVVVVLVSFVSSSGVLFSPKAGKIKAAGIGGGLQNPTNGTGIIHGNATGDGNGTVVRLPDLVIDYLNTSVYWYDGGGNGSNGTGEWRADVGAYVRNIGQGKATASRTGFVVTNFQSRYILTPALNPGQGVFVEDVYTNILNDTAYLFNATADGRFQIRESNENNNDKSTSFFV